MPFVSPPASWDSIAPSYDAIRENDLVYSGCVAEAVRQLLSGARRGRVLDAGCGTGITTLPLMPHFDEVVAVDFSAASLTKLRGKSGASRIRAITGDVTKLGFASGSFDAVLCHNTIQHLIPADQAKAVSEVIRVAKVGAPIVITAHHYHLFRFLRNWVKEGKPGEPGVDYIFRFMPEEFKQLFRSQTPNQLALRGIGFNLGTIPGLSRILSQATLNRMLGTIAARWHLGHMLMVVLVK